jgi:hypothetical protein
MFCLSWCMVGVGRDLVYPLHMIILRGVLYLCWGGGGCRSL